MESSIRTTPFQGRIAILGSGALGSYYGARLARAGFDVHFLMRSEYDAVVANGLDVRSCEGDFHLRPAVYRSAADIGPVDLAIVCIKATHNAALGELLGPVVGPGTVVLTLQNGLGNEEAIAACLESLGHANAAARVVGAVAFLCSHRGEPGVVHHTAYGWIRMAEFQGGPQPRTRAIAAMFEAAGISCEVFESVARIRWEKLVWNIPFNGLGVAARGADTAMVLADDALFPAAVGLMEETVAAARADNVEIDPAFIDRMVQATAAMDGYHASMYIDFREGRPMEVEAILGEPLRRARRAGINTPRLEFLYGVVRHVERMKAEG